MSGLASEMLGFAKLMHSSNEGTPTWQWARDWARFQAAAIIAGNYSAAD